MTAVKVKAWIDAHLSKMAMLPKRVDEMNEVEAAIFQIVAYHTGFLQFLSSSIGSSTPAESRCEELVKALELAEGRLSLLLQQYPDESETCDHPIATRYVLDKVSAAIASHRKGSDDLKELPAVGVWNGRVG